MFVHIAMTLQNRMGSAMLRTLHGRLPICAWCKRIKVPGNGQDGDGSWESVERFLASRTDVDFNHGICADCYRKMSSKFPRDGWQQSPDDMFVE